MISIFSEDKNLSKTKKAKKGEDIEFVHCSDWKIVLKKVKLLGGKMTWIAVNRGDLLTFRTQKGEVIKGMDVSHCFEFDRNSMLLKFNHLEDDVNTLIYR